MKHYDFEISLFIDNELPAEECRELFLHLAECDECNHLLSSSMNMKKDIAKHFQNIDINIPPSIKLTEKSYAAKKTTWYYQYGFAASIAAVIVLSSFLFFKQSDQSSLEEKYKALYSEVAALKENIHTADSKKKEEEVIEKKENRGIKLINKTKEISKVKNSRDTAQLKAKPEYKAAPRYVSEYAYIPSIEVKKENFIVQQMIGN